MHTPRNIQSPFTATHFWNNWNSATPRIALFVKITPNTIWSGVSAVGLTSNTRNMTLPGHPGMTFYSTPGITPTQIEQMLDEPTNLEMTGIYQTGIFEQTDVIAGKWNFATIEVFSASWQFPAYGELVHGKLKTGELKDYQTFFTAEARGMMSLLSQDVNKVTSRFCRVKDYGDAECGVDLNGVVTVSATDYKRRQTNIPVVNADNQLIDIDGTNWVGTFPPLERLFRNGKITFTSGLNAGVSREIAECTAIFPGLKFELKRPFPFVPAINDVFTVVQGCVRTVEACKENDNIANRRAEDWIPTVEAAHKVPPSS